MADIDTSELMYDPDFCDTVQLIRRTQVMIKGYNEISEAAPVDVLMSVQGPKAEDFQRFPDLANLKSVKAFWFNGSFSTEADDTYTDIVIWRGQRYQIHIVDEDYTNFGAGGHMKAFGALEVKDA